MFKVWAAIEAIEQHSIHLAAHFFDVVVDSDAVFLLQCLSIPIDPRPTRRDIFAAAFKRGDHFRPGDMLLGLRIIEYFRKLRHMRRIATNDAHADVRPKNRHATKPAQEQTDSKFHKRC